MAVIAVVGGPGAPGATTTALALLLAWPLQPGRRLLLVECDPDGGAVLAGALEGRVEAVYGLRNLAVADRRGLLAQAIWEQLIDLSPAGNGERLLLPGLTDPAQAPGLAYTWEPLVEALHALEPQGYDVLLDLGRSGAHGAGAVLTRRADAVAVTVRSTLRGLSSARPRLAALREDLEHQGTGADALGLLLIAEGPYPAAEVARQFGVPALGLLPHAPRTARILSDGGDTTDRRFVRSELMRTARTAADQLQLLVRRRRQRLAPGAAQPGPVPASPAPIPGVGQPYQADGQPYSSQSNPSQPYPSQPYPSQPYSSQPYQSAGLPVESAAGYPGAAPAPVPPGGGYGGYQGEGGHPSGSGYPAEGGFPPEPHPLAYPQTGGYPGAYPVPRPPQPAAPAPFPGAPGAAAEASASWGPSGSPGSSVSSGSPSSPSSPSSSGSQVPADSPASPAEAGEPVAPGTDQGGPQITYGEVLRAR